MSTVARAGRHDSRVLVTGALGFVGSHVALQAKAEQREVLGMYRAGSEPAASRLEQLADASVASRAIDLGTIPHLTAEIDAFRPDVVIHAAGSTRREPSVWEHLIRDNLVTTGSVVAAVVAIPETHRPALVLPGSQAEYGTLPMPWSEDRWGRPNSPYGASKLAATEVVLAAQRSGSIRGGVVRLPVVFGPAQNPTMFIPQLILSALAKRDFDMTGGEQRRRFLYVKDAASIMLRFGDLAVMGDHQPLLNAPATDPMPLISLARRVLTIMGDPISLNVGALSYAPHEQLDAWPDTTLADSNEFRPLTDLDLALRETIDSYSAAGPIRVTGEDQKGYT